MAVLIPVFLGIFGVQQLVSAATCTNISPPGSLCGLQGRLRYPDPRYLAEPSLVTSVEECARLCSRRIFNSNQGQTGNELYCVSFDYDPDSGLCQLSNQERKAKDIIKNGNHTFYAYDCFDCGDICDQPYGTPLIDNGNFESSVLGPWGSSGGTLLHKGHSSRRSYACYGNSSCMLSQTFNMCYEQTYAISFWYKHRPNPAVGDFDSLDVSVSDSDPEGILSLGSSTSFFSFHHRKQLSQGTPWRKVYLLYRKPSKNENLTSTNLAIQIDHYALDEATYTIDDFKVSRISGNLITKPGAKELFANGGFETGNFSSFEVHPKNTKFISVVSPGINSKHALQYLAGSELREVLIEQSLATVPGTLYLFSMDVRITSPSSPVVCAVGVRFGRKHDNVLYENGYSTGNHSIRVPILAQNETTPFSLILASHYIPARTTALVDNLSFKELAGHVF